MASKIRAQLEKHFGDAVMGDEDVMEECVQMCTLFDKSPEDLYYGWEAYSYKASDKNRAISVLDIDGARDYHTYLKQTASTQSAKPAKKSQGLSAPLKGIPKGFPSHLFAASQSQARQPLVSSQNLASIPLDATSLKKEEVFQPTPKAKLKLPSNLDEYDYKYMYEKLGERAEELDIIIEELAGLVKKQYALETLGDPNSMTESDVVVVGRICNDSEVEKANISSLVLESSRFLGSGRRVPLNFLPNVFLRADLPKRDSVSFYSGQIVALKGRNSDQLKFNVSEILAMPRLFPPTYEERSDAMDEEPTSAMLAAGPYSLPSDLSYAPFKNLLANVERERPSILILLGPFVDSENELIQKAAIDQSPAGMFRTLILDELEKLAEKVPGISILLVPSLHDIFHDHLVYPQNCFNKRHFPTSLAITFLPNPCVIAVNGINIGLSSMDVLQQLTASSVKFNVPASSINTEHSAPSSMGGGIDHQSLLTRTILEQRSFYPLFPAPPSKPKLYGSTTVDMSHSRLFALGERAPDILVLPSRVKMPTPKIVDRTLVVNPGFVTRGAGTDTFAKILIPSLGSVSKLSEADNGGWTGGTDLPEKIKVEFVKLA